LSPGTVKDPPTNVLRSGVSNGQSYTVLAATTDGASPDGHGRWHTRTGHLTGPNADGDPAVIAGFSSASDASVRSNLPSEPIREGRCELQSLSAAQ
jgi:hypothetical protein